MILRKLRRIRRMKAVQACKRAFTYGSFSLTFILIAHRLLQADDPATRITTIKQTTTKPEDLPFQVVLSDKSGSKPKIKTSLVVNTTELKPDLYNLKRIKGFSYDVFLFSAVVGNTSSSKTWDSVVIQGWEHRMYENTTFGCCIKYASGLMLPVKMTKKVHWAYKDKVQMPVKQYICPNQNQNISDLPEAVTISGNTKATACHKRYNWYITPYFAHAHNNKIAVCTKFMYGSLPADEILSWFEVHRRLGVSKVLTFTYKLNPEATKVLEYYKSIGLAEMTPFSLPKASRGRKVVEVGIKNMQAWNDEQIPVYDCFEKLKGYKYVAVVDVDEYLIPKKKKTWMELFDDLFKAKPFAAGFTFLVQLHVTTWGVTNNSSHFKIGQYLNRTEALTDRQKHVTRPYRLIDGGLSTHQFTPNWTAKFHRYQAKQEEATIHHFRSCRKEWSNKRSNKCYELERFTDTSLADIFKPIEPEVLKLKSAILKL